MFSLHLEKSDSNSYLEEKREGQKRRELLLYVINIF